MTHTAASPRTRFGAAGSGALAAAGLVAAVVAVHVEDQGGLTAMADPAWLGWGYRLLELGGALTAVLLVVRPSLRWGRLAALAIGIGPLVGYVLSRTTGLPGSSDDIGNWGEPLGVVSLVVEVALILTAAAGLFEARSTDVEAAPAAATTSRDGERSHAETVGAR